MHPVTYHSSPKCTPAKCEWVLKLKVDTYGSKEVYNIFRTKKHKREKGKGGKGGGRGEGGGGIIVPFLYHFVSLCIISVGENVSWIL